MIFREFCVSQIQSLRIRNLVLISRLRKDKMQKVLFMLSYADINWREEDTWRADKVDEIYFLLQNAGYSTFMCFYPFKSRQANKKTPYRFVLPGNSLRALAHLFFSPSYRKLLKELAWHLSRNNSIAGRMIFISNLSFIVRIRPSVILTIGAPLELILICRHLKIKVVEVMHGAFSTAELPISWADSNMDLVYENIKPDLFLSWHECYSEAIQAFGVMSSTIGFPSIRYREDQTHSFQDENLVLVSLSHGVNLSQDPYGMFAQELYRVVASLHSDYVQLRLRIHPVLASNEVQLHRILRWLDEEFPRAEIHDPITHNLKSSLRGTKLHITENSSTFFEAALLGIPTVMIGSGPKPIIPSEMLSTGLVRVLGDESVLNLDSTALGINPVKDFSLNTTTLLSEVSKLLKGSKT